MAYNPNAPYSPNFPASHDDKGFAPPPEMNVVRIRQSNIIKLNIYVAFNRITFIFLSYEKNVIKREM